ncbi:EpsG family protein [Fusobacterium ulcerans]|nr:EpsG family protein [Fusobacterium ulcerans]MCB8648961.1 EpsG family protein [Fusobacterium ulcerans]
MAILIPLLIAGCRKNVGTDYIGYVNAFYFPMRHNSIFMSFSKEYGFLILVKIAAVFNNYKIMFFLSELIILVVLKKIIDESFIKEKYLIYLLYLYIFYLESLNIGRQHIALVFYLYSIKYIFKKNLLKYTLTLVLGSLFHTSILLVFPMYFIYNFLLLGEKYKRVKKVILFGIQIFLLIFVFYYREIIVLGIQFFPKFKHYFLYSEEKIGGSKNLIVWMKLFFVFSILLVKKRLIKINDKNKFFIYGILIDLTISFIGFYQIYLKRLFLYFFINYIFLFPQLIEIVKEKWVIKMIILVIAVSFCILNFYILGHSKVIPYQI